MDFSDKTNGELFALLANVMRELRNRDLALVRKQLSQFYHAL